MSKNNDHSLALSYLKTGIYFNPSNERFVESLSSEIYVDKSEIIAYMNGVFKTEQKYVCVSRPRRFGKTMTAKMLTSYYSQGCDSSELFEKLSISNCESYSEHLNKYDVIFLDIQELLDSSNDVNDMIKKIKSTLVKVISIAYSKLFSASTKDDLTDILQKLYICTSKPIVFIIDEWDCIFREYNTDIPAQKSYLIFLRSLLKNKDYVGLAYITGILPIKKRGSQSELNMFDEFTMTNPAKLAKFVGFTHDEVIFLCDKYKMDYNEISRWYDGYRFLKDKSVYNPMSVVKALLSEACDNYWTKTSTYEDLRIYFDMNFNGLKDIVVKLLNGDRKKIDTGAFSNDMSTLNSYEDVLTLLIHLGYLGYDFETRDVFIPNNEILDQFAIAIKNVDWKETTAALRASDDLLKATWQGDYKTVAQMIDSFHDDSSHLKYNDENSLAQVIDTAYFRTKDFYTKTRELPTGKGFADIVYMPRPNHSDKPAMLIELKWDKSAATAIAQIESKNYLKALQGYKGNILLIGISYDKSSKLHECIIKRV